MFDSKIELDLDYKQINIINTITKNCILCVSALIFRNIGVITLSFSLDQEGDNKVSWSLFVYLIVYNISLC